jgi:hypothetical protein
LLYVGGAEIAVPAEASELARLLSSKRRHEGRELSPLLTNGASQELFARLVAMGALYTLS